MQHSTCYLTEPYRRKLCFGCMKMRFLLVQSNIVYSQHGAPHSDRTRALTKKISSLKIYGGISTCFFACHVEVYDHAPNRRYSKIKSSIRSCTPCDLYIQGTRWCTISSLFQELVELLSKNQLKKPLRTPLK